MSDTPPTTPDHSILTPPPAEIAAPVTDAERIQSIDVLRGVALLGILVMNIMGFCAPFAAYGNPHWNGEATAAAFGTWLGLHMIFDMKMMTIFSMLFGAGIIIFTERAAQRTGSALGVYYRRMAWLLVIGAAHGYLIWYGDILFNYATAGLLLYPARKLKARTLIIVGAIVMIPAMPLSLMNGVQMTEMRNAAFEAQALEETGEELTESQEDAIEMWEENRLFFDPPQEEIERQIEAHQGSWWEIRKEHAPGVVMFQTFYFLLWGAWRLCGVMMIGMGLYKLGVFSAQRSTRFYVLGALIGYAIGQSLTWYGVTQFMAHDFDGIKAWTQDFLYNYVGSVFTAFAHVCVVMLVVRSGMAQTFLRALAAVGRIALTNYLMQSIIATTIFYGYGFNMFAKWDRPEVMGVVVAIWVFQLIISPIWLSAFRFGPAEWLWRSLTYWRLQPFKR